MKITEYRLVQTPSNEPHRAFVRKLMFSNADGEQFDPWDEDNEEAQSRLKAFAKKRKVKIVERDGRRNLIVFEGKVKEGEILESRFGGMEGMCTADHRIEESS